MPPSFVRWAVALLCFGLALVALAILLYANHPECSSYFALKKSARGGRTVDLG